MKKILLGTTMLATAGMFASTAYAQNAMSMAQLSTSGNVVFGVAYGFGSDPDGDNDGTKYTDDSDETNDDIYTESIKIVTNATLKFHGWAVSDAGLKAGFRAKLKPRRAKQNKQVYDQYWGYIGGAFGTFEVGVVDGVSDDGKLGPKLAGCTTFVCASDTGLVFDYDDGTVSGGVDSALYDPGKTFKINYISPKISGFQVGASYIPYVDASNNTYGNVSDEPGNSDVPGKTSTTQDTVGSSSDTVDQFNGFEVGARYGLALAGMKFNVSAAYASSSMSTTGDSSEDTNGVSFGASTTLYGVSVGGRYSTENKETNEDGTKEEEDREAFEVGVGYSTGPWSFGVSYAAQDTSTVESGVKEDDWDGYQIGVGADYELGPGIKVGITYEMGNYQPGGATGLDEEPRAVGLWTKATF